MCFGIPTRAAHSPCIQIVHTKFLEFHDGGGEGMLRRRHKKYFCLSLVREGAIGCMFFASPTQPLPPLCAQALMHFFPLCIADNVILEMLDVRVLFTRSEGATTYRWLVLVSNLSRHACFA